jgi:hypothetical protein
VEHLNQCGFAAVDDCSWRETVDRKRVRALDPEFFATSLREIAAGLNCRGILTARGG